MLPIFCTGFGYLKWFSEQKQLILIPCYYSAEASGTIISSTDIIYSHMDNFKGWQMTTDLDPKTCTFILLASDGANHIKYPTFMHNNLWFHYLFTPSNSPQMPTQPTSIINALKYAATFKLWHLRLGHPGSNVTKKFITNTTGIPIMKPNKFCNCAACMSCKFHNWCILRLPQQ